VLEGAPRLVVSTESTASAGTRLADAVPAPPELADVPPASLAVRLDGSSARGGLEAPPAVVMDGMDVVRELDHGGRSL
jgi:hypothetical protein